MKHFEDFDEAKAAVGEGETLCGTLLKTGEPRYFVMPADATDEQIRARSFEIREGRPMSEYEGLLLEQAEKLRGVPA